LRQFDNVIDSHLFCNIAFAMRSSRSETAHLHIPETCSNLKLNLSSVQTDATQVLSSRHLGSWYNHTAIIYRMCVESCVPYIVHSKYKCRWHKIPGSPSI